MGSHRTRRGRGFKGDRVTEYTVMKEWGPLLAKARDKGGSKAEKQGRIIGQKENPKHKSV